MVKHSLARPLAPLCSLSLLWLLSAGVALGQGTPQRRTPLIHKVQAANERIEMSVNTSRIFTLGQKIPQAQVNNPDILELTPLSPTEIQVSAKAAGVTQITLWGEDKNLYTIDVVVYADAQALAQLLRAEFPTATLKVVPTAHSVLIKGYVDRPEQVDLIQRIAEDYSPKVINAVTVGGVQQVLLHVKVMEVSRTKLRRMGFDFASFSSNHMVISGISGLLRGPLDTPLPGQVALPGPGGSGMLTSAANETLSFGILSGGSAFFGLLEALRQDNLAKVNAEPTLVTISGRPASFTVGGSFPVPVPQSLGTISIEYKDYGTQLDFVPIVLGNGLIRLEVRPKVSEIDNSRSITVAGTTCPGLRVRQAETGVEMQAGQTMAIGGLIYHRTESMNRGLPWISEVPYLGALFRKVNEETNEIELLILVTPELVEGMDARDVPPCGPGMQTTSPNDWQLFMKGFPEVPHCCPNCHGAGCPQCAGNGGAPRGEGMAPDDAVGPAEPVRTPLPNGGSRWQPQPAGRGPAYVAARPTGSDNRVAPQNRYAPSKPKDSTPASRPTAPNGEPIFIGPIGYDVLH